jgi:hypothetical protein
MELNKTIQHYFHQTSLQGVTVTELEQLAARYPYIGTLQYLLLKKMKEEKSGELDKQWQKTLLYFQNPYYLHSLVQRLKAEPVAHPSGIPESTEIVIPQSEPITSVAEPVKEKLVKELTTELADALALAKAIAQSATEPESLTSLSTEQELPSLEEEGPALREDLLRKESPIRIPSLKDLGPVTDDMPSFEPYHTIDYFASQGIKLGNELPKDKLGRQLKSFTEWIRTMKKLPQTDIEEKLLKSGHGETIEALAADSIETREILTETMAEVLLKQGDKARAAEIFRKLSLAHPDKSAYFATRIEQLNNRS